MRVVCGLPVLWEQCIATTKFPAHVNDAVWSPCSRFIAIILSGSGVVQVLDTATLGQLAILDFPQGG